MEVTSLKNIKFETRDVEVFDGEYFSVKCAELEDILEVFGLSKEELGRAALGLNTSNKIRFLITLLQTLPDFVDLIVSQCVVNHTDLEMIHNALKVMKTERKIRLILAVFELSWDSIESFLMQMKTSQGSVEMIMHVIQEADHYEKLK